jgi:hypothetical protein
MSTQYTLSTQEAHHWKKRSFNGLSYGFYLNNATDDIKLYDSTSPLSPPQNNTIAEYSGLLVGLYHAKTLKMQNLSVIVGSEMIHGYHVGKWNILDEEIKPFYKVAETLLSFFFFFSYSFKVYSKMITIFIRGDLAETPQGIHIVLTREKRC